MDLVYAYNLNTNRPGIYMPERVFWVLFKIFGRPAHWDFIGGKPHQGHRQFADSDRVFYQSGNYRA
jgi:hypothetical protein